jgi:competence protein ComEA
MLTKLFLQAPPALSVLTVLIFLGVLLSREASMMEGLPVFLPSEQSIVHVEIAGDVLLPGVHQINDGMTLSDVIKLTDPLLVENMTGDPAWLKLLRNGESVRINRKDGEIEILQQGWMPASHRLAMEIPLHPDRMSQSDWTVLPGVGVVLADRIEKNRQKNGDYGNLNALMRVNGIGKKRVSGWRVFFEEV